MKLEDFFPYVLAEVPGCPDPTAKLALLSTCIEFCRKTLAWSVIQDPLCLIAGYMDYEIESPKEAYPLTVRDVWVGSRRLRPVTMHALQDLLPNWSEAKSNEPVYYNSAVERGVVRVFPIPEQTTKPTLTMRAAYTPTLTAQTVPDFLGQEHAEAIANGAKGRLLLMSSMPWFNAQLGAYYQQRFDDVVVSTEIREAHDRVVGSVTVPSRTFGF
jgi:hypothetical protein